jgi:Dehydratase family
MSMEVEETLRANPLDAVVLLSGCDKTTPAMLMAAASVDLPAIMVTGGPILNGKYKGADVGSGTDLWKFEQELVAGRMSEADCVFAEGCMARSDGALHDDGHSVHDGVHGRGARHAAAGVRRVASGGIPGVTSPPSKRGSASSASWRRTCARRRS